MAEAQTRYPQETAEGIVNTGTNRTVLSKNEIEIMDLISEGEIEGLVTGDYVFSGQIGATGYSAYTFYPYTGAPDNTVMSGVQWLRSIHWNEVPVINSKNQFNYQRVDVSFTPGFPNGALLDQVVPELSVSRTIGERLRGSSTNTQGNVIDVNKDFTKYYSIYNKECKGVIVNVRFGTLSATVTQGDYAGDIIKTSVEYKIYYRPIYSSYGRSPSDWILGKAETVEGKVNYGYIKSTKIFFLSETGSASDLQNKDKANFLGWEVKIIRTTPDSTTSSVRNQTTVDSITEIYSDTFAYPNCSIVRSRFEAEFFQQVPNRAYDTKLLKVKVPSNYEPIQKTYSEGTIAYPNGWDGTFKAAKEWTDNPAWCYYDLLTNNRYGLGKYINTDIVDKWTLYEIAKYCDQMVPDGFGGVEPNFTCNVLINSREGAFKVINDMASIFRGISYYGPGGTIYAIQDSPKTPIFEFNNASVENGDFNYQSSSKRVRHTVAIVRYNDKNNFFKPAIEYVEDVAAIRKYGIREVELTAFGCTSRGQAIRLGRWALLSETLETETIGFTAGLDAAYLKPGDVFRVFDSNRKSKRHAGRTYKIENLASSTNIVLDNQISIPTGDMYTFSLLTPGYYYDTTQVTNLASVDYSGIRHNMIQKMDFTGIQSTGLFNNEKTVIAFDRPFNITDYSVTGKLIWSIDRKSGISSYSDFTQYVAPQADFYRVINLREKEILKYEVEGLQYSEQKYIEIFSGLNFDRDSQKYKIIPQPPTALSLNIQSPTPNTRVIYYSFIQDNYSGVTSYRTFAKDKDYVGSAVPDNQYLISTLPVGVTYGYFLPSQTGDYFFRVHSYNDEYGVYSLTAATGRIEVKGINPIRDITISSLTFDNFSGANLAGNRSTGDYFNHSPTFRWQAGLNMDGPQMPSDFKYRVSVRAPSTNNIPHSTIYYQNTGYVPPSPMQLKYEFDIDTNAAQAGGPYRKYDIVVEAIDASGNTSAGSVFNTATQQFTESNWANFSLGYDIFGVNNARITGINLSSGGVQPPWELYATQQFVTTNGDTVIKFRSGAFPEDTVGAYVFASTGRFTPAEVILGRPWIQEVHSDFDLRSKTLYARTRLFGINSGFIGVAAYDTFDDYFIDQGRWQIIGSGLSGCYNVVPVYASGFLSQFAIGVPKASNNFAKIPFNVTQGDPGFVKVSLGFIDAESLTEIITTVPIDTVGGGGGGGGGVGDQDQN